VNASKTLGVAVVEQLGAMLVMAVYVVGVQHIMMTVLHQPEQSWIRMGWRWWLDRRIRLEREALAVWNLDPLTDEPRLENRTRED